MTIDIETPDGWIERPPEEFEDQLFVTEETYERFDFVAVSHVAVYDENNLVEHYHNGDYDFVECDTKAEVARTVHKMLRGTYE